MIYHCDFIFFVKSNHKMTNTTMNTIIEYRKLERKLGTDIFYILMDFVDNDSQLILLNKQINKFTQGFKKIEELMKWRFIHQNFIWKPTTKVEHKYLSTKMKNITFIYKDELLVVVRTSSHYSIDTDIITEFHGEFVHIDLYKYKLSRVKILHISEYMKLNENALQEMIQITKNKNLHI